MFAILNLKYQHFFSRNVFLAVILYLFLSLSIHAQNCGPNVPSFVVDLTCCLNGTWTSPDTSRSDTCCGATPPDRCIEFIVTLHPMAIGIIFDICSGAIPPGALFYQISCGNPTPVGEVLCLNGPGPHVITFCKPGNNNNEYCITSISAPEAGPDVAVNDGCSAIIYASGYDDTTITWTSVFPGPPGTYDNYLSCTQDCDSVLVTAQPGYPPFVDFQVCGFPFGGCDTIYVCDTVRVYFNSTLAVTILPIMPTICFGDTSITLTANGSGGTPPYSYLWNTGATTQTINVNVGTYIIELSDTSVCPPTYDTVTVTAFANPISANAGPDQTICVNDLPVALSGTVIAAAGGTWWGGNGTYNPSNDSLNTLYMPSTGEIANGSVTLYLTTTGNGSCPADTDTIIITIVDFTASVTISSTNVTCFGANDGIASVNVTGGTPPYLYLWSDPNNQTTPTASGLGPGVYDVTITDGNGCDSVLTFTITEPLLLSALISTFSDVSCNGANDGSATVIATGGSPPYSYQWSPNTGSQTTVSATGLSGGTYSITVTDANGCTADTSVTINEPTPVVVTVTPGDTICIGDTFLLGANATGGNGGYTYVWNQGLGNGQNHSVSPSSTTTYVVTTTDNSGCPGNIDSVTIVVLNLYADSLIAISTGNICEGETTAVYGTHNGIYGPYSYNWSQGLGTGLGPFIVSPTTTTTYVITVTDNCGNAITDSVTVEVYPFPAVNLPDTIAEGCVPLSVTFTDTTGNPNNGTYYWDFGDGFSSTAVNPVHTYIYPGSFNVTLTITSIYGCVTTSTNNSYVIVYANPIASFTANPTETDLQDPVINFIDGSFDAVNWLWKFGDGDTSSLVNPTHTYQDTGTYMVILIVINEQGCTDTFELPVRINPYYTFVIPNAFTPSTIGSNGGYYNIDDYNNNVFFPFTEYVVDFHMMIFNRWGELIFESFDINIGWDGYYREQLCQQDVYVWKIEIEYVDGKNLVKAGDLTLIK